LFKKQNLYTEFKMGRPPNCHCPCSPFTGTTTTFSPPTTPPPPSNACYYCEEEAPNDLQCFDAPVILGPAVIGGGGGVDISDELCSEAGGLILPISCEEGLGNDSLKSAIRFALDCDGGGIGSCESFGYFNPISTPSRPDAPYINQEEYPDDYISKVNGSAYSFWDSNNVSVLSNTYVDNNQISYFKVFSSSIGSSSNGRQQVHLGNPNQGNVFPFQMGGRNSISANVGHLFSRDSNITKSSRSCFSSENHRSLIFCGTKLKIKAGTTFYVTLYQLAMPGQRVYSSFELNHSYLSSIRGSLRPKGTVARSVPSLSPDNPYSICYGVQMNFDDIKHDSPLTSVTLDNESNINPSFSPICDCRFGYKAFQKTSFKITVTEPNPAAAFGTEECFTLYFQTLLVGDTVGVGDPSEPGFDPNAAQLQQAAAFEIHRSPYTEIQDGFPDNRRKECYHLHKPTNQINNCPPPDPPTTTTTAGPTTTTTAGPTTTTTAGPATTTTAGPATTPAPTTSPPAATTTPTPGGL